MKKLQLLSAEKSAKASFDIAKAKGRPMLQWVGKKPLDKVEYYPAQEKEFYGDKNSRDFNKLFWGDNLQVLAHLLKEYRGEIDLIYIDPPFDSKADYVKKVQIRGEQVEGQQQGLLEEKQYTDIWEKDEYLQFMYERFLLMRELLADTGSFYLHCDWHKSSMLRLIMDEVFGEENFISEITWANGSVSGFKSQANKWIRGHDTIYFYAKNRGNFTFNKQFLLEFSEGTVRRYDKVDKEGRRYKLYFENGQERKRYLDESGGLPISDVWTDILSLQTANMGEEYKNYPTQKPEGLIERIIKASSNEGDLVADFFVGSGTTPAVAQKLGRQWVACDINQGAIQTTAKRLNQIIQEQQSQPKLLKDFKGLHAFKIYNVNDYDVFKNELEAKEVVMEMYGIEPVKRAYFDGVYTSVVHTTFVKVMPVNRVLNKMDIRTVLKKVDDLIGNFTPKTQTKLGQSMYQDNVLIICSGVELDVADFLKKENKSGVEIEIRDIQKDKKNLIFKQKPEARIAVRVKDKKLLVELKEFYSPILMRKLEIENEKALKKEYQAKVEDFRQIIDSVAVDIDYNGKLFNAEIIDLPSKKELIKAKYEWIYPKSGKNTVAVKIVDVLGEEYFETFEVTA